MRLIHKKRPTRWHRDGYVAPCGAVLYKRLPLYRVEKIKEHSYEWINVTCKECLKFKIVIKVDFLNKFKESK